MNKVMLGVLGVSLVGVLGWVGYAHMNQDSWDKRLKGVQEEMVQALLQAGATEDQANKLAGCYAPKLIGLAKSQDCPLKEDVSTKTLLQECLTPKLQANPKLGVGLQEAAMQCQLEVLGG